MSRETSRDIFDAEREISHKQRMEALRDFGGLEKVDLHDPGSPSERKKKFTNQQRPIFSREVKSPQNVYIPKIAPRAQLGNTTHEQRKRVVTFKLAEDSPKQKKEMIHGLLKVSVRDQKRDITYEQKPNFLGQLSRPENLYCPKISPNDQKREATYEQRLRSLKEFEGIEYPNFRQLLEIDENQNNNIAYKIDRISTNSNPKTDWLQNRTRESAKKPNEIKEAPTHDIIKKETEIKYPSTILNKTPIETVNVLFPLKQSLNHRMAAIRQRNVEVEKATKITETSPGNAKKEFVAVKNPIQFGEIKNRLAAFRKEHSKSRINKPSFFTTQMLRFQEELRKQTSLQDAEKKILKMNAVEDISKNNGCDSKNFNSEPIQSKDEFDNETTEDMGNTIQIFHDNNRLTTINSINFDDAQSNKIENEAGPDSVTLCLYKAPHFSGSRTDFFIKKLNLPACKDKFVELLQSMNCAITRGELSCAKSSRMPHYVLETWINDNASSRIQLCQMAVTLRRMMAAISLAEKQCANRNNIVNIVEIAVKQNQTLNTTIDTEMFSEYFDGAPMSIPSYHIDKFYLEEASASALYPKTLAMCSCDNHLAVIHEEVVIILQYIHEMRELDGAILVFLPDWEDLVKVQNLLYPSDNVVVHLVSSQSLNDSELHDIHSKPPPGKRKIILATDIAQSFISIDDLVYVVDTGMRKCEFFDIEQGINVFDLEWISRANANQRVGLTGSLGESYHFSLYTEERYRMFVD